MWVANLYKDKGASLASFIIENEYKLLPKAICVENKANIYSFGKLCPKLKTIILHFKIKVLEEKDLKKALNSVRNLN